MVGGDCGAAAGGVNDGSFSFHSPQHQQPKLEHLLTGDFQRAQQQFAFAFFKSITPLSTALKSFTYKLLRGE
jgi:hypothetical protein